MKIIAGLIVKNEERDLPTCLKSINSVVDGIVIVDTGSTDKTKEVAYASSTKILSYTTYLDASVKDETGDWKLWNFSQARNEFIRVCESFRICDYILWMDADDELLTPDEFLEMADGKSDVYSVKVDMGGGILGTHHRLWRARKGIRFEGAVHEYPTIGGFSCHDSDKVIIKHNVTPGIGEDSNARNLRILLKECSVTPNSRNTFYLANTYRDGGKYKEAIPWYSQRIALGTYYRDEFLFSYLYKARCERACGLIQEAIKTLLDAIAIEPNWSEYWMELAYIFENSGNAYKAMSMCYAALSNPNLPTQLWREPNKYTDQPRRMLTRIYRYLDKPDEALFWAKKAKEHILGPDLEWDNVINILEEKRIAIVRPGAIGDIIMTLNLIPLVKQRYPGYKIDYFCHPNIGKELSTLMYEAGINKIYSSDNAVHNYLKAFNLVGYPLSEGYPQVPMKKHLLRYFADELDINLNPGEELPALQLKKPDIGAHEKYITIHPKAGWSVYKNWPIERWEAVVAAFPEYVFYQIGAKDDPKIAGAKHMYMGNPLQLSISLLANAVLHLGVDSFTNHLTNYVWGNKKVPAVILWGSTQHSAAGYSHNINISLDLTCQPCFREDPKISQMPLGPCINPPGQEYDKPNHACMMNISVESVIEAIKNKLNEQHST